jgi:hypothetical protein
VEECEKAGVDDAYGACVGGSLGTRRVCGRSSGGTSRSSDASSSDSTYSTSGYDGHTATPATHSMKHQFTVSPHEVYSFGLDLLHVPGMTAYHTQAETLECGSPPHGPLSQLVRPLPDGCGVVLSCQVLSPCVGVGLLVMLVLVALRMDQVIDWAAWVLLLPLWLIVAVLLAAIASAW